MVKRIPVSGVPKLFYRIAGLSLPNSIRVFQLGCHQKYTVDQTEPGKRPSTGTIGLPGPAGRIVWRCSYHLAPLPDDADPFSILQRVALQSRWSFGKRSSRSCRPPSGSEPEGARSPRCQMDAARQMGAACPMG